MGWRLSVVLLALVLAAGTAGFVLIEGWSTFDALYMTVTTVTTVGYGEIHPLSTAGRVFNIGVLIFGVATVLYTFSFFMARLVEGDLHQRWIGRRRRRMLDELDHHFIICGYGRMGQVIAEEFARQAVPFVEVINLRVAAEQIEQLAATHAQQNALRHAGRRVRVVEMVRDRAREVVILRDVSGQEEHWQQTRLRQ